MLFSSNIKRNGKGPQGNFVFRRKKKKLHVELKHRLDLNPETDATRRQKRLRTAGTGAKIAVGFLLVIGLFSAGRIVIKEAFIDNSRFHLHHFSVKTDGDLSSTEIIAASGLEQGINMLGVSLVKVKERLLTLPEVKSAKVSREFPGVMNLEVEQRKAVAWLSCPEQGIQPKVPSYGVMLDAEGYVLPGGATISESENRLPVIQVAKLDSIMPGQKIASAQLHTALDLLLAHDRSKIEPALHLRRIDVTKEFCMSATYDNRVTVNFPSREFDSRLQRLGLVMAEARKQNWQLATVDLLVEQNVPITLRPALAATPTQPAAVTPPARNRRAALATVN